MNPKWYYFGLVRAGSKPLKDGSLVPERPPDSLSYLADRRLPCARLPGASDVFVVVKTGATESRLKIPVQSQTSFRCIPNFDIYSDLEEVVSGHVVHDALDDINSNRRYTDPVFELYRDQIEAQHRGRKDFTGFLVATDTRAFKEGVALPKDDALIGEKIERASKLDGWKVLPILEKAILAKPRAKWFVFIEADTALIWSNLLAWLARFDPSVPQYFGSQAHAKDLDFAHGSPGFILSNRAVRLAVDAMSANASRYETMLSEEGCGDLVLGRLLHDIGIDMLHAWPILQNHTPATLEYTDQNWCHAVVSFHHMSPSQLSTLWGFEQAWVGEVEDPRRAPAIKHAEIFYEFVAPHLTKSRAYWDNMSQDKVLTADPNRHMSVNETRATQAPDGCRLFCESREACLQWRFQGRTCAMGHAVRLGFEQDRTGWTEPLTVKGKAGFRREIITSGWIVDRIEAATRELGPCEAKWIVANEEKKDD